MTLDEAATFHVDHCDTCADQTPALSPWHSDALALHRALHEFASALVAPFTWLAGQLLSGFTRR